MKRRPILTIILVILCLALLGHVVWCLVHHIHGEKAEPVCSVCGKVEAECDCKVVIDGLRKQLADLQLAERATPDLNLIDECNHPHWDENTLVEWDSSDNPVIIGTEDGCIAYYRGQKAVCADCGEEIIIASYTVEPGHQFGDDDICDRCGYKKPPEPEKIIVYVPVTPQPTQEPTEEPAEEPCTHSHVRYEHSEWECQGVDPDAPEDGHIISRLVYTYCKDCGILLGVESESKLERHDFDIYGECKVCGYKLPQPTEEPAEESCTHSHVRYEYSEWECQGVYPDAPEDGHIISRLVYTYCKDCGILLGVEQESKLERHDFNRYGECKICGYKPQQPSGGWYPPSGWNPRRPLGEDEGTAPGTIGGESYEDSGVPGTPVESFEDPGQTGTPVESFEDPGAAGKPVEGYTDTGAAGTPVESFEDPGAAGKPVEGYTDTGAAGKPVEGYTDTGAAGTPAGSGAPLLGEDGGEATGSMFEDDGTPGTPIN